MLKKSIVSERWDKETDVIVVGAGDAGLSAAIEAAAAGSPVLVFEKMASIRTSSSAMSGGALSFAGTDFQRQNGVNDSSELYYRDMMELGEGKNDPLMLGLMMKEQLDTYRWLEALGIKWLSLMEAVGMSVPRIHSVDPVDHVNLLLESAKKQGVEIFFRTKVTKLVLGQDRRVSGAIIEKDNAVQRIKANKGVVLATGGFARDKRRLKSVDPRLTNIKITAASGHTGDGHRMAESVGAGFKHMAIDYLKPSIGRSASGHLGLMAFRCGAILVNKYGHRFIDESSSDKVLGMASLSQKDNTVYEIFDQKVFEKLPQSRPRPRLDEMLGKQLLPADSIDELASKFNIHTSALVETVARYNSDIEKGSDGLFGRIHLGTGSGDLVKIDTPPFYGFASVPALSCTLGGLSVDTSMRVLNGKGGVILGLYAAGEIVGGFHGGGYHIGSALTKALVTGRIAGRNVAAHR